jgi:cytidyltransferase-like protein
MIVDYSELGQLRQQYKDKKIVLGSGVFDLLHRGHLHYLQLLKDYGDIVVVMVKSDLRIRRHKHPSRPIIPQQDRALVVDAIKGVDYVFIGPYVPDKSAKIDQTYEAVLEALKPDVLVSTDEKRRLPQGPSFANIIAPSRHKQGQYESTTAIIQHIRSLPDL